MGKSEWTKQYLKRVPRVIICDPMDEYEGTLYNDPEDMIEHVRAYRVYKVRTTDIDALPVLCSIAMAAGRCTLVIDEAQRTLPQGSRKLPPQFEDIIYRGRHKVVSLVLISQRPSTVHIAARSQFTRMICFRQTEKNDVAWIQNTAGEDLPLQKLRMNEYYEIDPVGIYRGNLDSDQGPHGSIDADASRRPGAPGTISTLET
jgi:hypothetical protein